MREILFRGKRVDNGEWETGSLIVERMNTSEQQVMIADKMTGYPILVIPETVGEYTGLKDVHGTRIFEKDIVRIYYPFDDPDGCVVSWSKEGARWDFGGCDAYFCTPSKNCEVIGNVYDNQELLKGE